MIVRGDIFNPPVPVDGLVNPVNCVGVMGAGLALQFKLRYPEMFDWYQAGCRNGDVRIGSVGLWQAGDSPYIITLPTKQHWRDKSKLEDIQTGLDSMVHSIGPMKLGTIAIPALGCGLGGLNWHDVKPLIEAAARQMPETLVLIYEPK